MTRTETPTHEALEATPKRSEQISLVGQTWSQKSDLLAVINERSSALKTDALPPDPFGDIDGQLLALKKSEKGPAADKTAQTKLSETNPDFEPIVNPSKVIKVAEHLGFDQERWRTNSQPHGPKCNLYLDAVMKDSGLPRPWAEVGVQSCEKLDALLAKDARYEKPWTMDYSSEVLARINWQYFSQQPGDIFIWNRPDNGIIHSAIADGSGKVFYAGSHTSSTGFGHTKSEYFTGTPERPLNYGPPTSVYRYARLQNERI